MPKDTTLHKILLIGSGPIVIGQGCEFDYSGVQACKALKEEGYTVILVNSNPATIMTDPEFAHRTYIEPITPEVVEKIIEREKPDALLPTLGGQTALNCAMKLFESGVLEKHGVKMIGANAAAIHKGEDRQAFKDAMIKIGLDMPRSGTAHTKHEARNVAQEIGAFPLIIRPAFTLGGSGGGIAYNKEEFEEIITRGLDLSPVSEVLIEESLLGWKEFEMEVMRDRADNCVIICSIENVDPMGVHTGDSITVAPIQTLTDREFQVMRDASFAIIREIGVETGGSNIQFAVHPETGRMIVIEMNPRVSRSSALASKATGFPIAKIAAKLAVGYTLDEVRNDITRETPASFEPTIDYVVVKCPRFTFEKFPQADPVLTTQMKSVGEAMAIGRTFKEALQKALRSLEIKRFGLIGDGADAVINDDGLRTKLTVPNAERIFFLGLAFQRGWTVEEVFEMTKIDRWFLENIRELEQAARDWSTGFQPVRKAGVSPAGDAGWKPAIGTAETAVPPVVPEAHLFQGFDDAGEIVQSRRNLPHWQQSGATYFVTFRLADAVPATLLAQWEEELDTWQKFHPKPWDTQTAFEYRLRFHESREAWLDQGHGACALRDPHAAEIVARALRHFDGERYLLDAFVVMPNHVHVLFKPLPGHTTSSILHSWKSFTAKEVNKLLGRTGTLWQDESFDRMVRDWEALCGYRAYIAGNPEKAKLRDGQYVLGEGGKLQWSTAVPTVRTAGFQPAAEAGETPAVHTGRMPVLQLRRAKRLGFSDVQLAIAGNTTPQDIRAQRKAAGIIPTYRLVDTCAAEFEAYTPYYYSTYGDENERRDSGKKKIIILGGGPNRIGQGIEFDYCCVHAAFALREEGFETIMVNSNPETVSTDYDTSDKLYFEPLTLEDVLNICEQESENLFGVIVQFGGQTPLNLAAGLQAAGVPIIGTSPKSIEIAEDRKLFGAMLDKLGIRQTSGGTAVTEDEAVAVAERVGYPVLVRPSFVLGGRGMMLVHNESDLRRYVREAVESGTAVPAVAVGQASSPAGSEDRRDARPTTTAGTAVPQPAAAHPILVDHFLEDAVEVDVDCIADGEIVVIGAIMEHIEEAGIHSGDSSCVIPSFTLKENVKAEIAAATKAMARELNVRGLMNVQFAVKDDVVYVLEVNPRASRTAPFVSKAIGVQLPKLAAKIMAGKTLKELGFTEEIHPTHFSVKEAVFPFIRFPGIDIVLGPEMKSTGEVMGIGENLGLAFAKAQMAAQPALPTKGNIFISVADRQKTKIADLARGFVELGFTLFATSGTSAALKAAGIPVQKLFKLNEGRPNALDMIKNGELAMIINTPSGKVAREDEVKIRSTATGNRIPIITTLRAATASLAGIRALREHGLGVKSLQEYHGG